MKVSTYEALKNAVDSGASTITLTHSITAPAPIHLAPGQRLEGENNAFLGFMQSEGIGLAAGASVAHLRIQVRPDRRAIYLNSTAEDLGTIELSDLTVSGVVQILTRKPNHDLSLRLKDLDIVAADARAYSEKPQKYGVNVYQGALTVYNYSPDETSLISVEAENIRIGRAGAPVLGSGIFIAGFNDNGGRVVVERLTTDEMHSNGMIPFGQPNLITGGIFILNSARAKEIHSHGDLTTYGVNDMVLDVWGHVECWIVDGKVTSYGPSGIGFVNFGTVDYFEAKAKIETLGLGARGFNQYDGTIEEAYFSEIETHGDGSIAMQYSKPVGKIVLRGDVTTNGSEGETLVQGQIVSLFADALSVKEGGVIRELIIEKDLVTKGDQVVGLHVVGGTIERLDQQGEIRTLGQESKDTAIEEGGKVGR